MQAILDSLNLALGFIAARPLQGPGLCQSSISTTLRLLRPWRIQKEAEEDAKWHEGGEGGLRVHMEYISQEVSSHREEALSKVSRGNMWCGPPDKGDSQGKGHRQE